jgi:hypothetical protein
LTGAIAVSAAFAQSITGTIVGTVTDISGAAVSGAAITVINEETSIEYTAAAGGAGEYSAPNLPPGTYTVRIELAGFKPSVVKGLRLLATRTIRVDNFRKRHHREHSGKSGNHKAAAERPHARPSDPHLRGRHHRQRGQPARRRQRLLGRHPV